MSSPKVITYTMDAFSSKLHELMRMQSRLEQMSAEIQCSVIEDAALNIHFDCKESYSAIDAEIKKALVTMVFDYKGSFSQHTHDVIRNKIDIRMDKLSGLTRKCDNILTDFKNRQKDYNSYIEYGHFIENSKASLEKFKQELQDHMDENFAKSNAALVEDAKKKIGVVSDEQLKTKFDWGFDGRADDEKSKIVNHVIGQENVLREVRRELLMKVAGDDNNQRISTDLTKLRSKLPEEIVKVSQKIELLINGCDDKTFCEKYNSQFNKLKQSESMTDLFFYQELHDRILKEETTRRHRVYINQAIAELNLFQSGVALQNDKNFVIRKAIRMLDEPCIIEKEIECLKMDVEAFYRKSRQKAEEAATRKKERQFIKTQIINNLENLGYEVMEDLNVIDFEKENDFYLKVPGQENLLNLKFKDDGSFRYVFEIPEKVGQLSVDQQKMRLHEMRTTCGDFMEVVSDLKKMGVKMEIKSEMPEELGSLVTIPESVKAKINKQQKQAEYKQQIRKLYLD